MLRLRPALLSSARSFFAAAALIVSTQATPAHAQTTLTPGQPYLDPDKYVEFVPGALPIVLTSPHGGRSAPTNIPDRREGVTQMDANTQELTREIHAELLRRTGRPAHMIISLLHRRKLDPNREIREAAQGNARAELAYKRFHGSIRAALRTAIEVHGFAFLVDIHGHGHTIPRLELGYAIDGGRFNQSDSELDRDNLAEKSTLNDLFKNNPELSFADVIRGPKSLGALLQERGFRSVPSPRDPGPKNALYFNGGHISRIYARDMPGVDGLQIECQRPGVRETAEDRKKFAQALVDSLIIFLEEHYRYAIVPASTTAAAPANP